MKAKTIPFIKYQGIGNDYLYINAIDNPVSSIPLLARKMSDRNFGVGSDGLILVYDSKIADYKMRIFNADGSEAEMCGNGIRGFAKYLYDYGLIRKKTVNIETLAGVKIIDLEVKNKKAVMATVDMGEPVFDRSKIPMEGSDGEVLEEALELEDAVKFDISSVSMGNPHTVIFVEDVDNFPVHKYGPMIENHPLFPKKTNVEFVQLLGKSKVKQRTWERGSGETLACGTGATAVAVVGNRLGKLKDSVTVNLKGGSLNIRWDKKTNHVFMTGPSVEVFKGEWSI